MLRNTRDSSTFSSVCSFLCSDTGFYGSTTVVFFFLTAATVEIGISTVAPIIAGVTTLISGITTLRSLRAPTAPERAPLPEVQALLSSSAETERPNSTLENAWARAVDFLATPIVINVHVPFIDTAAAPVTVQPSAALLSQFSANTRISNGDQKTSTVRQSNRP